MTLNCAIALILCLFSPNLIALQADYVTVVEDRVIMSVKYGLPVPVFHYWPELVQPVSYYRLRILRGNVFGRVCPSVLLQCTDTISSYLELGADSAGEV